MVVLPSRDDDYAWQADDDTQVYDEQGYDEEWHGETWGEGAGHSWEDVDEERQGERYEEDDKSSPQEDEDILELNSLKANPDRPKLAMTTAQFQNSEACSCPTGFLNWVWSG